MVSSFVFWERAFCCCVHLSSTFGDVTFCWEYCFVVGGRESFPLPMRSVSWCLREWSWNRQAASTKITLKKLSHFYTLFNHSSRSQKNIRMLEFFISQLDKFDKIGYPSWLHQKIWKKKWLLITQQTFLLVWIFAPWPQKFLEIFGKKKFRENSTNFAKNLEFFLQYFETTKLIIKKK